MRAYPDGTVVTDDQVPPELFAEVERALDRPYAVEAVRQGRTTWAFGARALDTELVVLPRLVASALEVALPPDGEVSGRVDGEPLPEAVEPAVDEALRELERRGRLRFESFVARADKLDETRWELSIDPL